MLEKLAMLALGTALGREFGLQAIYDFSEFEYTLVGKIDYLLILWLVTVVHFLMVSGVCFDEQCKVACTVQHYAYVHIFIHT